MSNTVHGVTIDARLQQAADQYLDALIALDEFAQPIPRIRINARPPLTAHPELSTAFTPQGIASLLVCVITIQQTFGRAAPSELEIAPSGDQITWPALLGGEDVPNEMVPDDDFAWIMPAIGEDLPAEGVVREGTLPSHTRRLVVHEGVLMSRATSDSLIEMDAGENATAVS